MIWPVRIPLSTSLGLAAPALPRTLAEPSSLQRLSRVSNRLRDLSSHFCVEARLGRNARREPKDLLVSVLSYDGGRERFAELTRTARRSEERRGVTIRSLSRLARAWNRDGDLLKDVLRVVWLELDEAAILSRKPVAPLVFLCPEPTFPEGAGSRPPDHALYRQVVSRAMPLVTGGFDARRAIRNVHRALAVLPNSAYVVHFAHLGCRGIDGVRIVFAMQEDSLASYLAQVGWPGAAGDVVKLLKKYPSFGSVVSLHLDVSDSVGPRAGLEYWSYESTASSPMWGRLFDALEKDGLCTPAQRAGLERWGGMRFVRPEQAWWWLFTGVQVKLTINAQASDVSSKCYLGFTSRTMPV